MKKLVMVFALGAMLGSCGSDPADIEVKSLDTPCACAEAGVAVLKEMADFKPAVRRFRRRAFGRKDERITSGCKSL